ncbi:MAG: adenylate/guanylate cyclase domain-containing protein, partial [Microbacterium sp.]
MVPVTAAALVPRLLLEVEPHVVDLPIEGTAVLIDISGFTVLSEQLAAAGREGTEQLIATLSRIFTVLLPVTDDGGDIVKFAGDALFILFRGDDHAKHAAHAAWNMNRVLAAIGDIHLPAARARLRMSVGVHSGTFPIHLTGASGNGLILTGRDTTRVLELQNAAEAGRILVSAETAALLPPAQTRLEESTAGAHRLLRAGSVRTSSLMALVRGAGGERFLPHAFAQRPDLLAADPDHRWAAVGFIQVSGVPDEPGADDLERMDAVTATVEAALTDTGGTLLDIDPAPHGYRYFVTAGAPTTVEDPEGRLLTALQRIVTTPSELSLRAGATSGRVFAGFVGAPGRQTYTVMGDETNLAARLTARAEPGTVLVSRGALDRSAVTFASDDHGEITVKGKSAPIPVAVLTSAGSAPEGARDEAPFHGRRNELARIIALRRSAETGIGGVLTVSGGAGAGKSRLVQEGLRGSDLPVLHIAGDRFGTGEPYRALQAFLRPLLGIAPDADAAQAGRVLTDTVSGLRRTLVPWLPLLAPAVGAVVDSTPAVDALDEDFRLDRTHAMIARLVDDLLPEPTCIAIDDAQWMDAASAGAIATAFAHDDVPHAVYVMRRDGDGGLAPGGEALELGGLEDADAAALIEAIAGRSLLPADLAPIIERGDGNPLYLGELAAGFAAGSDTLGIEQLVGERLDALSEQDRAVVRRAAVLGWGVPVGLFVRCVGPAELAQREGISGFLETLEDTIRFRSGLFRDVAYHQLNFQTRRELHRSVAAALIADPSLAGVALDSMLAVHYEAAGDWARAIESATRTAEAAVAAFALEDAVRAYRVAVAAAAHLKPAPAELPALWESLGRVALSTGRATEALDAFDAARALTKDAAARARLDRRRAHGLMELGRNDDALRALATARRGAKSLGEDGRGLLASIALREAALGLWQARWGDARRLSLEAIALLQDSASSDDDRATLADAFRYHDIAASEPEGDDGMIHLQHALDLYEELGDEESRSKVLSLIGVRAYYRGAWSTAAGLYAQAESAAEAAGDTVGAAIESANVAEILVDQGRVAEAIAVLGRARHVFDAAGNPFLVAFATGYLARAHLRGGDAVLARGEFQAAAAGFRELD